jgi:dTDP-4-amino-4,6-dideoxygalactose transaminase
MIRLSHPSFAPRDLERIAEVLASGMLIQGKMVAETEALAAAFLGAEVVACSSGTAAVHLALMALDLRPGDEVILPTFTWPSVANCVVREGATPVFVDMDPATLSPGVAEVEAALTPATRAVIAVHLFGLAAPVVEMAAMLERRAPSVRLIEDAACAIGTRVGGAMAGTIGWVGCVSLHPRKIVTTGEGGLLVTHDAALARRLRRLRNHGMEPGGEGMTFLDAGLNYRLSELGGALGVGQMELLEGIIAARRSLGERYLEVLQEEPLVEIPAGWRDPGAVFQAFVVWWRGQTPRPRVVARMRELGVETTMGTYSCASQPFFRERFDTRPEAYPVATAGASELLSLPLHPKMELSEVETVVAALRQVEREWQEGLHG